MKVEKNAETVRDDPVKIKYRGLFDLNALSDHIKGYYAKHKFDPKVGKYKWKGKEGEWQYHADRKISEYIKVFLYCDCWFWILREQEVVEDGEKKKKYYGKIHLEVNAAFWYNYGKTFNPDKSLQKRMIDMLDNPADGIQFGDLKGGGEKVMEKVLDQFVESIKSYLGMECLT